MSRKHRWKLLAVLATAALAAAIFWLVPIGSAFDEVNERPAPLGLVGMTEGQLLRISVASIKGFDPQPDPPGCRLKVGFVDPDGSTIGDPHIVDLRPGASVSFEHLAIGDPSIREYVRPVVSDLSRRNECPAVVAAELLDRAGVSGIIVYDNQPVAPGVFLTR